MKWRHHVQSIAPMTSSCRNCRHTSPKSSRSLSSIRGKPRSSGTIVWPPQWVRGSHPGSDWQPSYLWWLQRAVRPCKEMPPQAKWPTHWKLMLLHQSHWSMIDLEFHCVVICSGNVVGWSDLFFKYHRTSTTVLELLHLGKQKDGNQVSGHTNTHILQCAMMLQMSCITKP